jgi:hypothetical protein
MSELESLPCNVVCLPFYSSREAHTRMLSPDMWAQEHNGRNTLMQVTSEQSPGALMSVVHALLICGGCFLGNMRVMMSVVHAAVWVCCLPMEWTRTPPVELTGRRLPAEWIGLNKC